MLVFSCYFINYYLFFHTTCCTWLLEISHTLEWRPKDARIMFALFRMKLLASPTGMLQVLWSIYVVSFSSCWHLVTEPLSSVLWEGRIPPHCQFPALCLLGKQASKQLYQQWGNTYGHKGTPTRSPDPTWEGEMKGAFWSRWLDLVWYEEEKWGQLIPG
jgi:hypothetical protein